MNYTPVKAKDSYSDAKKCCCFTGHRPKSLPFGDDESAAECVKLKELLRKNIEQQIVKNGVMHFISGMAMGVDIYGAEIVLKLKEKYPQITLECAIPFEAQANRWDEKWKKRYFDIIRLSDNTTTLQTTHSRGCMMNRNRYMVDNSDVVIAVWNGEKSGTGNTVRYAKKCGKKIILIDPNKLK